MVASVLLGLGSGLALSGAGRVFRAQCAAGAPSSCQRADAVETARRIMHALAD
jgi:hypothetical protein